MDRTRETDRTAQTARTVFVERRGMTCSKRSTGWRRTSRSWPGQSSAYVAGVLARVEPPAAPERESRVWDSGDWVSDLQRDYNKQAWPVRHLRTSINLPYSVEWGGAYFTHRPEPTGGIKKCWTEQYQESIKNDTTDCVYCIMCWGWEGSQQAWPDPTRTGACFVWVRKHVLSIQLHLWTQPRFKNRHVLSTSAT